MKQTDLKRMFLIFSHELTDFQKKDAIANLGVDEFVYLPDNLKVQWLDISPYDDNLTFCLQDLISWLKINARKGDYVLVQGDFGATFLIVDFCLKNDLIPVYSNTKREVITEIKNGENIKVSRLFTHVRFRKYERWT
ncbi:MAG: CRISPR-associated protein Csx20 [Minisyncoccia bacterium]